VGQAQSFDQRNSVDVLSNSQVVAPGPTAAGKELFHELSTRKAIDCPENEALP
jgi:hypothetical protein